MSDDLSETVRIFLALHNDLQALKSTMGRALKVGAVHQVDKDKGYRLNLGERNGKPFLSPWYPHPETGKTSMPLKVGQIVGVINPGGDPRRGLLIRGGYSDDHPSPNEDMEANVFEDAGVKLRVANGALHIEAGGCSWIFDGSGLRQTGGTIRHNDIDIGDGHRHKDVFPGTVLSGPPTNGG